MIKIIANKAGGANGNEHSDVINEDLIERLKECDECGEYTKPLVNQITFLHDYRQMIVFWQNTVRLISYEDNCSHPGGRTVPVCEHKLPVYHDFTFHKVAMDKYALTQRQLGAAGTKNHYSKLMISSDEDEPDDDFIDMRASDQSRQKYESSIKTTNTFSSNTK